jgi:NAD(P)-dependent dehydrogenase (short-subunit alcohol dehydrogenase family)
MTVANHVVIVTSGGTGIGAAIARLLAQEGAQVTITSRRQEVSTRVDEEGVHHGKRARGDR